MSTQLVQKIQELQDHLKVLTAKEQALTETVKQVVDATILGRTQVLLLENIIKDKDTQIHALKNELEKVNKELAACKAVGETASVLDSSTAA